MKNYTLHWSHHHTHRLLHLSHAIAFSFGAFIFLFGSVFVWLDVHADTVDDSGVVAVTAQVGEIQEGPVEPSGSYTPPPKLPAIQPTLSIMFAPSEYIHYRPTTGSVPIIVNMTPAFFGTSNIPGGEVTITIPGEQLIRASLYADDQGSFTWTAPALKRSGAYTITIRVVDPSNSDRSITKTLEFIADYSGIAYQGAVTPSKPGKIPLPPPVITPVQGTDFDIFVRIPDVYDVVIPGQKISAEVRIIKRNHTDIATTIPLEFVITDEAGNVILRSDATFSVTSQYNFLKTFFTAPNVVPGKYFLTVQSMGKDSWILGSDSFVISTAQTLLLTGQVDRTNLLAIQAFLFLALLFLFIAYFQFRHIRALGQKIRELKEKTLAVH